MRGTDGHRPEASKVVLSDRHGGSMPVSDAYLEPELGSTGHARIGPTGSAAVGACLPESAGSGFDVALALIVGV
jgi:hypothetical protein